MNLMVERKRERTTLVYMLQIHPSASWHLNSIVTVIETEIRTTKGLKFLKSYQVVLYYSHERIVIYTLFQDSINVERIMCQSCGPSVKFNGTFLTSLGQWQLVIFWLTFLPLGERGADGDTLVAWSNFDLRG